VKRCKVCGELKLLEDFYRSPGMRDGHRNDCKVCNLAARAARNAANPQPNRDRVKRWREQNPEKYQDKMREYAASPAKKLADRKSYLRRKYGITVEEYDAMLAAQGGVCKICEQARPEERTLHVDHDHMTGKIRGLLCFRCNNAIGDLRDDAELALAMVGYLERDDELERTARERALTLTRSS
jgi:hypothetical protein